MPGPCWISVAAGCSTAWPTAPRSRIAGHAFPPPPIRKEIRSTLTDSSRGDDFRRRRIGCGGTRREAPALAAAAVRKLRLGAQAKRISHVIVTTCTGFSAPGLDLELIRSAGLDPAVERTVVGFMGCYAGINALKLARHIVRSEPTAQVLILSLELCTLHLQETADLEQVLSFLVFGDGCAAVLVSAEPKGFALERFHAVLVPETADLITWRIRELGFDMFLSGRVPAAIARGLRSKAADVLDGQAADRIDLWAVHPGGRSVLDAVEGALELGPKALAASRDVLERLRQHVVGDDHVRASEPHAHRAGRRARLRHGVRPRPDGGNPAVPGRRIGARHAELLDARRPV